MGPRPLSSFMHEKHDQALGSTTMSSILSSAYFQPRVVDAYLASALQSPSFPADALTALAALTAGRLTWSCDEAADSFEDIRRYLRADQVDALHDAIRALSSSLTLAAAGRPDGDSTAAMVAPMQQLRNRCLLGYCKTLNRDWLEALVDLDLVRGEAHRSNRREAQATVATAHEMGNIYRDALAGLQLASLLLGRQADADRFARWRGTSVAAVTATTTTTT